MMERENREMLEKAALFHAAQNVSCAREVFSIVSVADFTPGPAQDIAAVILGVLGEGEPINPMAILTECGKVKAALGKWYALNVSEAYYSTPEYVAREVHQAAQRDRALAISVRLQQRLQTSSIDVEEAVSLARGEFTDLDRQAFSSVPTPLTFDELMALEDDNQPWTIYGMLRRREVMMLTGQEGGGKSLLLSQIMLGASTGISTLSPDLHRFAPQRVFVVDVENDNVQIRDNLRKVWPMLKETARDQKPDLLFSPTKAVDLTKPKEQAALIREIVAAKPDIVYMGTVYKIAPTSQYEEQFFAVRNAVDAVRDEIGSSFLIENHGGHDKDGNGVRDFRPFGSSMWRRWPNFGIGLVPSEHQGVAQLKRWRGDRARGRQIPIAVKEGRTLPWVPVYEDEWEAVYA